MPADPPNGLPLADAPPARPFLKWAGGKGRLLGQLDPLLPPSFGRYIEPFVGAGALFFHLHALGRLKGGAILSDINTELMNCYRVVQDASALDELLGRLEALAARATDADFYYRVRAWDRDPASFSRRSPAERAARTIFLNHTCYNGLYRLNRRGQFNVPYGKWSRPPRVFDEANLRACHRALQDAELHTASFDACLGWAKPADFVYLDPPYDPVSATASFTTYNGKHFSKRKQKEVADLYLKLDELGCAVVLSNSDTRLVRTLYSDFAIRVVEASRAISCRGAGRGTVRELVVLNYNPAT